MNSNKISYQELQKKINEIILLTEQVKSSLTNMDSLIESTINSGMGIWDGEVASDYKQKWDTLLEDIPTFVETFEMQGKNIQLLLDSTIKAEQ